jgi:hypothetical protein
VAIDAAGQKGTRVFLGRKSIGVGPNQVAAIKRKAGIDVIDGTPLLDIKPYVEGFDRVEESRSGWLESSRKRSPANVPTGALPKPLRHLDALTS